MSTLITQFATINCDGPECQNTITYEQTKEGEQEAFQKATWLNSLRIVSVPGPENQGRGRVYSYCSDECEIKATGAGGHNKKVIVIPHGPNATDLAAQAAARAQATTQALKSGDGKVTLG